MSGHGKFTANESKQLFTSVSDETDENDEYIGMDLGFDLVQLLLCSKILHIPGNYFKFQRLIPLLLFTIKSSLPGAETPFSYMFSSSSLLMLLFVSQTNLYHGALTHKNPKARSLMAAFLQHLVKSSTGVTVASIFTRGCSPQL